ncbi:MAG TPA: GNAT family N-acetyltransferase, partial [Marinobacter adhaerens]|nr:GNAT family N-acetyltransferase [Marinobacter adhaerens]
MAVSIRRLSGDQIKPYLDDLARLRIEVFRHFPYLYDGDMDYERK